MLLYSGEKKTLKNKFFYGVHCSCLLYTSTGYWAARISEITEDDTVLIIGAGPTGICTLLCVMLKHPKKIIVCETDDSRIAFINKHYPEVLTVKPANCVDFVEKESEHGGADAVSYTHLVISA